MLDYNVVSLFVFLSFSSKTKRRHPSFRHNSCFCSHFFKKDDVVLPFVLTHTAQPLHENIINIALSICIMRTVPPRLQFFPFFCTAIPADFFPFLYNFLLVSMILSLDFEAADHVFFQLQSKGDNSFCASLVPATK